MRTQRLRDLAKFGAGLITGDFIVGVWFVASGYLPFTFLGVSWTVRECLLWLVFDAILIAFLVFYGWHITDRKRTKTERLYLNVAGSVFALVSILHLSRLLFGWALAIDSWTVPYWLNMLGAIVALFLSLASFHFASHDGTR